MPKGRKVRGCLACARERIEAGESERVTAKALGWARSSLMRHLAADPDAEHSCGPAGPSDGPAPPAPSEPPALRVLEGGRRWRSQAEADADALPLDKRAELRRAAATRLAQLAGLLPNAAAAATEAVQVQAIGQLTRLIGAFDGAPEIEDDGFLDGLDELLAAIAGEEGDAETA